MVQKMRKLDLNAELEKLEVRLGQRSAHAVERKGKSVSDSGQLGERNPAIESKSGKTADRCAFSMKAS